ncbi:hypothetical protein BC826DRAFT_1179042 [Russula brevipes]|nr:hypothetical protein BC826DRAFT_1179042 [Russula brevipes]
MHAPWVGGSVGLRASGMVYYPLKPHYEESSSMVFRVVPGCLWCRLSVWGQAGQGPRPRVVNGACWVGSRAFTWGGLTILVYCVGCMLGGVGVWVMVAVQGAPRQAFSRHRENVVQSRVIESSTDGGSLLSVATSMNAVASGPVSLPASLRTLTFVSDAEEDIFLPYTRLAALKPPDSTDTGHFHELRSEDSKEDTLLVHIELQLPPTVDGPVRKFEKTKRNVGRRNKGRIRKGSSSRCPRRVIPTLKAISLPAQLAPHIFTIEFLSLVLRQLHFPEPTGRGLFDYAKLAEAGAHSRTWVHRDGRARAPSVPPEKPALRVPDYRHTITVAALDWALPALRSRDPPGVLLVVDCIYHPTLVRPQLAMQQ